jgi:hypothetical protein
MNVESGSVRLGFPGETALTRKWWIAGAKRTRRAVTGFPLRAFTDPPAS